LRFGQVTMTRTSVILREGNPRVGLAGTGAVRADFASISGLAMAAAPVSFRKLRRLRLCAEDDILASGTGMKLVGHCTPQCNRGPAVFSRNLEK
jgi:hypothetical protein